MRCHLGTSRLVKQDAAELWYRRRDMGAETHQVWPGGPGQTPGAQVSSPSEPQRLERKMESVEDSSVHERDLKVSWKIGKFWRIEDILMEV